MTSSFSFCHERFLHLCLCLVQQLLDSSPCIIDHLPDLWSVFRRNIFHAFKHCGKFALSSEKSYSDIIQFFRRISRLDLRDRLRFDLFQFLLSSLTPFRCLPCICLTASWYNSQFCTFRAKRKAPSPKGTRL